MDYLLLSVWHFMLEGGFRYLGLGLIIFLAVGALIIYAYPRR
jgi:hypothetical protein